MIVRRLIDGVDDRLDSTSFLRRSLHKVFPDHWSFMLGELTLYSFVLLLLTGTFLSMFYVASPETTTYTGPYAPMLGRTVSLAYDSVLRISLEVRAGLVMRQTHHWSALMFMAAMVAHLVRVFFTGAFRKPREMSWLIGVTMLVTGIGAGFTGYSLPDDLLSGTGLRIIYSAVLSIPLIGTWLAYLFFGGEFPASELLPRLFVMHVLFIPALLVGLLSAHLALVWRQTHTQFPGPRNDRGDRTGTPVWPKFALKAIGLAFVTFGVLTMLGGLVQSTRSGSTGRSSRTTRRRRPSRTSTPAGWRGCSACGRTGSSTCSATRSGNCSCRRWWCPGIIFTVLALWPFLEARATHDTAMHHYAQRPREAPVRSAFGAGGIAFFVLLMLAGSNDVLAKFLQVEVDTLNTVLKVLLFVVPIVAGVLTWWICRDLRRATNDHIEAPSRVTSVATPRAGSTRNPTRPPTTSGPRRDASPVDRPRGDDRGRRHGVLVLVRYAAGQFEPGRGGLQPVADLLPGR